jgi:hypothetical protein
MTNVFTSLGFSFGIDARNLSEMLLKTLVDFINECLFKKAGADCPPLLYKRFKQ